MIHMDGEFMKQLNMKAAGVDLRPKAVAGRYDKSFANRLRADFKMNYELYILAVPVVAFFLIFCYKPMYGAIMAFKDFVPSKGILGSPWAGWKHFEAFFSSMYFPRLMKNTIVISLASIVVGFPAPIILALMMNEVRSRWFARTVQTCTYLPHFISLVVICGMIKDFVADTGVIGSWVCALTGRDSSLLNEPGFFVPIYVISDVWQGAGWGSIVYLAALMGIDQQLYEAAQIDGAGRWKQTIHVTLPGILPTIIIMLVLRMGNILNVGFEKIILLYNEAIYSTSDVISTFVYRKGLQEFNYSFSTAVGLFNSVINLFFLFGANFLSKRATGSSLW